MIPQTLRSENETVFVVDISGHGPDLAHGSGLGPGAGFGLEEGDDIGFVLPGDAEAAEAAAATKQSSGTALVLAAPSRVGEGQPFLVRLTSDQPLDSVSVHWLGKEVIPSISVWNNRHVALAMLGTDVLNAKMGKDELTVIASIDGKENTFRRTVQITRWIIRSRN